MTDLPAHPAGDSAVRLAAMGNLAAFVAEWAAAWNVRDLDRLMTHYAEDVVWTSPMAVRVMPSMPGSDGVLRGKDALRTYFARGLELLPELHFEVLASYLGVSTLVINYRNERDGLVCEVLVLDRDGLVIEGHGTYAAAG